MFFSVLTAMIPIGDRPWIHGVKAISSPWINSAKEIT
jgi:hypothetical protein